MIHLPVVPGNENTNAHGSSGLITTGRDSDTCPGYTNPEERHSYSLITGGRAMLLFPTLGGIIP